MGVHLLILGGTCEARRLSDAIAQRGIGATVSLAGRVARPKPHSLPMRVGGFGGVEGLRRYLREHDITHVIDATHPFAAQMSANAVFACAAQGIPLIALTRPPWQAQAGDRWQHVPDISGAVAALARPAARVMLAVGRTHLAAFALNPQHHYVLRLVDPPQTDPPFPNKTIIVDRGPFSATQDCAVFQDHGIELIVSKNAGGSGASAKLDAARALALPVIMIARPQIPARAQACEIRTVMQWLAGHGVDLGV